MNTLAPVTVAAIDQLEAALAAKTIPAKEAETCARLLENLRRPVRVGLIGAPDAGPYNLLSMVLGEAPIPAGFAAPTMEIAFGDTHSTSATLSDASVLAQDGWPDSDLMDRDPVFLKLTAPIEALRRTSFLHLALSTSYSEQAQALVWAANRLELTLWCSQGFPPHEADLWANAPEPMKNHAFLIATGRGDNPGVLRQSVGSEFEGVFAVAISEHRDATGHRAASVPGAAGLDRLMRRITSDIDEAHLADLDAARLFLHRFGQGDAARASVAAASVPAKAANLSEPAPAPQADDLPPIPQSIEPRENASVEETPNRAPALQLKTPLRDPEAVAATRALVSEPMLYLKRRARALLEMLDWEETPTGDWVSDVLEHCCETTEALRDRAANWPDDDFETEALRDSLDEAWDVAILLQVEGGEAQARDAATMLLQLRGAFERAMAA